MDIYDRPSTFTCDSNTEVPNAATSQSGLGSEWSRDMALTSSTPVGQDRDAATGTRWRWRQLPHSCIKYITTHVSFLHSGSISLPIAAIPRTHAVKLAFHPFLDRSKQDGTGSPHLSGFASPHICMHDMHSADSRQRTAQGLLSTTGPPLRLVAVSTSNPSRCSRFTSS